MEPTNRGMNSGVEMKSGEDRCVLEAMNSGMNATAESDAYRGRQGIDVRLCYPAPRPMQKLEGVDARTHVLLASVNEIP